MKIVYNIDCSLESLQTNQYKATATSRAPIKRIQKIRISFCGSSIPGKGVCWGFHFKEKSPSWIPVLCQVLFCRSSNTREKDFKNKEVWETLVLKKGEVLLLLYVRFFFFGCVFRSYLTFSSLPFFCLCAHRLLSS